MIFLSPTNGIFCVQLSLINVECVHFNTVSVGVVYQLGVSLFTNSDVCVQLKEEEEKRELCV